MNRTKKGFTLVELLVVIAIIGIISAVAVPVVISQIDKAKVATVENEASTTVDAVQEAVAIVSSDATNYPDGPTKANIMTQLNIMYRDVKNVKELIIERIDVSTVNIKVIGVDDVLKNGLNIVKEQSYAFPIAESCTFVMKNGRWAEKAVEPEDKGDPTDIIQVSDR